MPADLGGRAITRFIVDWAAIETRTARPECVNAMQSHVEALHRNVGMEVERTAGFGMRGYKLIAPAPWGNRGEPGVVISPIYRSLRMCSACKFDPRSDVGPGFL